MNKSEIKENVTKVIKSVVNTARRILVAVIRAFVIFVIIYFLITTGIIDTLIGNALVGENGNIDAKEHVFSPSVQISNYEISQKFRELEELVTYEEIYSGVQDVTNSRQIFGQDIFGTEKSMKIYYECVIKAGIETDDIKFSINEKTRVITVSIPEAQIYDCYISQQDIAEERNNIFNPIDADDVTSALEPVLDQKREEAERDGLLDLANECAREKIQNLLSEFENMGYAIEFK